MRRAGDVLPGVASALGLDRELQMARAMSTWERIVAEHVPAAAGASRVLELKPPDLVVSATVPIVAQELRLRADELIRAFGAAPGGTVVRELRIVIRAAAAPHGPQRSGPAPRVD